MTLSSRDRANIAQQHLHLLEQHLLRQFVLSAISFVAGIICLVLGSIMTFLGLEGSFEWAFQASKSISSKLVNASPGIIFTIIGFLIVVLVGRGRGFRLKTPDILSQLERMAASFDEEQPRLNPTEPGFGPLRLNPGEEPPSIVENAEAFLVLRAGIDARPVVINGKKNEVTPLVLQHTSNSISV